MRADHGRVCYEVNSVSTANGGTERGDAEEHKQNKQGSGCHRGRPERKTQGQRAGVSQDRPLAGTLKVKVAVWLSGDPLPQERGRQSPFHFSLDSEDAGFKWH